MFYILRRSRSNAVGAEVADALPASSEPQASTAVSSDDLEIRRSRLFYIRRYGPIMGTCLYELDASLRASGGSARR
ncbi:hypothetical protein SBA2_490003 [Acidobacteriia bacterium SbA2]|nr:hypothetical protein SBA2_490003 [Acidobacteriia bacterium SbA2]